MMKILFLTTVLPSHKLHGSEIASQNVIDALNQVGCQVTVVGYGRKEDGDLPRSAQEVLVGDRLVETKRAGWWVVLWMAASFLKKMPYSAAKYWSRQYIDHLRALLQNETYDAVVIDHAQLGWLYPLVQPHKVIFSAHNVEHELYAQNAARSQSSLHRWIYAREARLVQQMENQLACVADEVWALTEHDADYFAEVQRRQGQRHPSVKVLSLPSGFAAPQSTAQAKQFDIGIIGSWPWKPNEEGLLWFLERVYPYLPSNLCIHIAGRGADWLVDKYPNIHYRGFVPSAQEFMAQARVVAIPMLSGGGIQIKTLDAIAAGSAIVATPVALRGIAYPPATVRLAETPEAFAQLLIDTVDSTLTTNALQEAQRWFTHRQQQFIHDIAYSLSAL